MFNCDRNYVREVLTWINVSTGAVVLGLDKIFEVSVTHSRSVSEPQDMDTAEA